MPHQDMDDLRTPVAELKEVLAPLAQAQFENASRHDNTTLNGLGIAMLALLAFGWSRQKTLSECFETARDAGKRSLGGSPSSVRSG